LSVIAFAFAQKRSARGCSPRGGEGQIFSFFPQLLWEEKKEKICCGCFRSSCSVAARSLARGENSGDGAWPQQIEPVMKKVAHTMNPKEATERKTTRREGEKAKCTSTI